jgi:hypothetical protein
LFSAHDSSNSTSSRDQGDGGLCSLLEELAAENTDCSSTSGASSKMLLNARVLLQNKGKISLKKSEARIKNVSFALFSGDLV